MGSAPIQRHHVPLSGYLQPSLLPLAQRHGAGTESLAKLDETITHHFRSYAVLMLLCPRALGESPSNVSICPDLATRVQGSYCMKSELRIDALFDCLLRPLEALVWTLQVSK